MLTLYCCCFECCCGRCYFRCCGVAFRFDATVLFAATSSDLYVLNSLGYRERGQSRCPLRYVRGFDAQPDSPAGYSFVCICSSPSLVLTRVPTIVPTLAHLQIQTSNVWSEGSSVWESFLRNHPTLQTCVLSVSVSLGPALYAAACSARVSFSRVVTCNLRKRKSKLLGWQADGVLS